MTNKDKTEITLTDGHSTPVTGNIKPTEKPESNPENINSVSETLSSTKNESINAFNVFFKQIPINKFEFGLLVFGFFTLNILIGIFLGLYNVLGVLSILTGGFMIASIYAPQSNIEITTKHNKILYTIFSLVFIAIGIWYALIGIVFTQPV